MLQHHADRPGLCFSDMVELQNNDVGLAAINAGMTTKVGVHEEPVAVPVTLGVLANPSVKPERSDSNVVCGTVNGLATLTDRVSDAAGLPAKAERIDCLNLPATPTAPHRL